MTAALASPCSAVLWSSWATGVLPFFAGSADEFGLLRHRPQVGRLDQHRRRRTSLLGLARTSTKDQKRRGNAETTEAGTHRTPRIAAVTYLVQSRSAAARITRECPIRAAAGSPTAYPVDRRRCAPKSELR